MEDTRILEEVPPFKLDQLKRLTDDTGMMQHGLFTLPGAHHGYSIDDQARALILAIEYHCLAGGRQSLDLAVTYLRFLNYAQLEDGRFHNFLAFDRRWEDAVGSEDSNGRAVWALGYLSLACREDGLREAARDMLLRTYPWQAHLRHPRARAFALTGLSFQLQARPDDTAAAELAAQHAGALVSLFGGTASPGWEWFENHLTYSNGRLPYALLLAHSVVGDERHLEVARESLDFLLRVAHRESAEYISLVGQDGWYSRGEPCARFDQQPVDAHALVDACVVAHRVLGEERYLREAELAFAWYHGRNTLGVSMYDRTTGGCFDGLTPVGVNRNQGAESTLSYLLSHLAMVEAGQLRLRYPTGRARRRRAVSPVGDVHPTVVLPSTS